MGKTNIFYLFEVKMLGEGLELIIFFLCIKDFVTYGWLSIYSQNDPKEKL